MSDIRCQQQRHRALLIDMGARQRIAVAVHRRLLLPPFNLDTAQPRQRVAGGRESRVVQLDGRAHREAARLLGAAGLLCALGGITEAADHRPFEWRHCGVLGA